jgi:HPt (histidine-containing phosphotransfer) domain-containing protein
LSLVPLPDEFTAFLETRRAEYGVTLPRRVAEVVALSNAIAIDAAPPKHLADLDRLVHSLAGSAGMFGFAETGAAARALESALAPLQVGYGLGAEERNAVAAAASALERCVVR